MEQSNCKYSKKYFESIAEKISEIKFLVALSENPGELILYVFPKNELISKEKITEDLKEKAELNVLWHRKNIQIIFLKSSVIKTIE